MEKADSGEGQVPGPSALSARLLLLANSAET